MRESLLRTTFRDIFHPITIREADISSKAKLWNTIRIWAVQFVLALSVSIVVTTIASLVGYNLEDSNKVYTALSQATIIYAIFQTVIYAPIVEEIAFRLMLKASPYRLAFGFVFLVFIILEILEAYGVRTLSLLYEQFTGITPVMLLVFHFFLMTFVAIWLGFFLSFFRNKGFFTKLNTTYRPFLFYATTLIFGFIHIANFQDIGRIWYLIPILVLPQLVISPFIAYVRLSYGFKWAVLLHGFHNFVATIPIIIIGNGILTQTSEGMVADPTGLFFGFLLAGLLIFMVIALNIQVLVEFFQTRPRRV